MNYALLCAAAYIPAVVILLCFAALKRKRILYLAALVAVVFGCVLLTAGAANNRLTLTVEQTLTLAERYLDGGLDEAALPDGFLRFDEKFYEKAIANQDDANIKRLLKIEAANPIAAELFSRLNAIEVFASDGEYQTARRHKAALREILGLSGLVEPPEYGEITENRSELAYGEYTFRAAQINGDILSGGVSVNDWLRFTGEVRAFDAGFYTDGIAYVLFTDAPMKSAAAEIMFSGEVRFGESVKADLRVGAVVFESCDVVVAPDALSVTYKGKADAYAAVLSPAYSAILSDKHIIFDASGALPDSNIYAEYSEASPPCIDIYTAVSSGGIYTITGKTGGAALYADAEPIELDGDGFFTATGRLEPRENIVLLTAYTYGGVKSTRKVYLYNPPEKPEIFVFSELFHNRKD